MFATAPSEQRNNRKRTTLFLHLHQTRAIIVELDSRTPLATINVTGAKPPWSRPFLQKICVANNHEQAASEIVPPPAALAAPFSHLQKMRKQSVITIATKPEQQRPQTIEASLHAPATSSPPRLEQQFEPSNSIIVRKKSTDLHLRVHQRLQQHLENASLHGSNQIDSSRKSNSFV